jgi:LPS sulfotransferase NodH
MAARSYALVHSVVRHRIGRAVGGGRRPSGIGRWTAPWLTYLVCTNPRSGSWLLCEGLTATGLAGRPREWFNPQEEERRRTTWRAEQSCELDYPAYLRLARRRSTTPNGVSGVKLHHYQLRQLARRLGDLTGPAWAPSQVMRAMFPGARHIWLIRRDKARQAISYFIAARTNDWFRLDEAPPTSPQAQIYFDPGAIAQFERTARASEEAWGEVFEQMGVQPLVVAYEDLAVDYTGTLANIVNWLGLPRIEPELIAPPRLRRQADARTEDWLARYKELKQSGDIAAGRGRP